MADLQGKECQCTICGRIFTSESAFNRHKPDDSGCANPGTLKYEKGGRARDLVFNYVWRRNQKMWYLRGNGDRTFEGVSGASQEGSTD